MKTQITARDLKEAAGLVDVYNAAAGINNGKEIEKIETEIWALYQQREKQRALRHDAAAFALKNKLDILRGQIQHLELCKHKKTQAAFDKIQRFLKPFRQKLVRDLETAWAGLERAKQKQIISEAHNIVGGRVLYVDSNIMGILDCQLELAECNATINGNDMMSLRDMAELVEKTIANIPAQFELKKFQVNEREREFFGQYFPDVRELENDNFKSTILPPALIKRQIENYKQFEKERG